MSVIRLLPTVRLDGLAPAGVRILSCLDRMAELLGHDLTVTCGREGHPVLDPHTRGEAFDVRTNDLSEMQILTVVQGLRKALGPDFTVLYEVPETPYGVLTSVSYVNAQATGPHIHAQLRKGYGVWPMERTTTGLTA